MRAPLVFQSDFGLVDGAVAAMHGVALEIDPGLQLFSVTHDITPYNIWEASYRLFQSIEFWPRGTVFVSVVDPGVGSQRKSVAVKTLGGQYIVTPDNGTLTHIKKHVGIAEVREIEESAHRRANTQHSYTFHGRDLYANTGAKIAAGVIGFEEVGPVLNADDILELPVGTVEKTANGVKGCIDILDVRFGSLWTNVPREEFLALGFEIGDRVEIAIHNGPTLAYNNRVVYARSFADVYVGEQLVYVNSLYRMAVAINQGNFARAYAIGTGIHWSIEFRLL